jgi:hypothetical protein
MRLIVALLCFASSGCGVVSSSSHCTFAKENRCQERVNTVSAEAFKGACAAAQGVSADGACPAADRVGGCSLGKQGDGSSVNDWYYAPKMKAEVQDTCTRDGTAFLEP